MKDDKDGQYFVITVWISNVDVLIQSEGEQMPEMKAGRLRRYAFNIQVPRFVQMRDDHSDVQWILSPNKAYLMLQKTGEHVIWGLTGLFLSKLENAPPRNFESNILQT